MNLRPHALWLLAALLFSACVLPFLVFYTGVVALGPYSHGGALGFYGDFLADLARLRWSAWLLLLGPAIFVIIWRTLAAYAWREGSD
ncbi:MAG: hypothetical protein FIB04_12385 [Gammaproteobacteria bacterium]|nr:hypothetical protein [Gammaproteobacteria bacterium]